MSKLHIFYVLAAAVLLASCGSNSTSLVFSNYEKNTDAQGPEGAPASLELTLPIPQGEGDLQANVTNAIKEIISHSRIAEEMGAPEGESLQAIADSYYERFKKGVTEGELEGLCVYHLQIVCQYQNPQCVVLQVSDGVYGNGGPREYVWNVRLSDGHLMLFNEFSTMTGNDILALARRCGDAETKEAVSGGIEDGWLSPDSAGCRVKVQLGTHFFHDFVVPMENVIPYLTEEGKALFGVNTKVETDKEPKKEAEENTFLSNLLTNYRELVLKGLNGRQIEREIRQFVNETKQNQLPVVGSPYGISCSKAVIDDYNVQDDCINIIMELVPDAGTDFHLEGYKGIGYSADYGPYGKFVQAQAFGGEQFIFARTCHCNKGKMLVTLIIRYDDLQLWKTLDHISLVEKKS